MNIDWKKRNNNSVFNGLKTSCIERRRVIEFCYESLKNCLGYDKSFVTPFASRRLFLQLFLHRKKTASRKPSKKKKICFHKQATEQDTRRLLITQRTNDCKTFHSGLVNHEFRYAFRFRSPSARLCTLRVIMHGTRYACYMETIMDSVQWHRIAKLRPIDIWLKIGSRSR